MSDGWHGTVTPAMAPLPSMESDRTGGCASPSAIELALRLTLALES